MKIILAYFPVWKALLRCKLGPKTPLAPKDVDDNESRAYRRDSRLWFEAVPNKRTKIWNAVLELQSDDNRYEVWFKLVELADDSTTQQEVFKLKLDNLCPQEFTIPAEKIKRWRRWLKPKTSITIHIVEAKVIK